MKFLKLLDKVVFKNGNTLIYFFILSCIISRANLNFYFFDILSQLGFQIFIGGFFLIIILLFLKRYKGAIICLIINFIFLFDILYSCKNCNAVAGKDLKNNNNLKILIFNVEYSNSIENFEKVRTMINLENPDIIQLAETSGRLSGEVKKLKKQYPHTLNLDKRKDIFDTVIFSKYPLKNKKDLTDNIVTATVIKNSKQFNLISVHFVPVANKLHTDIAHKQMETVRDYINKNNKSDYILLGDLNMTLTSKRFTNFLKDTNLYTNVSLFKPTSTWPAKMQLRFAPEYVLIKNFPNVLGIQIDHILYSSKFKLIDKKITNSYGSDHRGLIANLAY
jgi:endonuclease/exonuclease/phosphatase (EEP) superfamily protein YafD